MPKKGSVQRYCNRNYVLNKDFYNEKLVEKQNTKFSYNTCKEIIHHANKLISEAIQKEVDGFKLPLGKGYLCTTKYIANKPMINWPETNKLGKYVYHTNMHTDGYSCRIMWYRVGRVDNAHFHEIFKFKADTKLSKAVSLLFRNGKNYHAWEVPDFIEKGRLENLYNKKYRKN